MIRPEHGYSMVHARNVVLKFMHTTLIIYYSSQSLQKIIAEGFNAWDFTFPWDKQFTAIVFIQMQMYILDLVKLLFFITSDSQIKTT